MNYDEFCIEFKKYASLMNIVIEDKKIEKYYKYMELLLEWNEKINLTAITNPREIIIKHFIDSIIISKKINKNARIIDIGTGAGFPGIPLKIYDDTLDITLLDSLNKRTIFLKEVITKLDINKVDVIHGRAEDFAQDKKYRAMYDYAVSRAVAPLNILCEYLIPYVKKNGTVIAMKGSNIAEELQNAKSAILKLKANVMEVDKIELPENNGERNIVIIEKKLDTPNMYPRKAGIPKKNPL